MASKKDKAAQASLVEDLEQELEDTKNALEEANQRATRAARDVDAYAARASARMRRDQQEQQAKRREADRKERYERIENIGAGLLPLKHATDWAIINEDGESGLQVFVPLSVPEQRAVQDYLNRRDRGNGRIGGARISHSIIDEVARLVWAPPVIKPGSIFLNGGIY